MRAAAGVLALALALGLPTRGAETSVFDLPALGRDLAVAARAFAEGRERQALARLDVLVAKYPAEPEPWRARALLHARAGRAQAAAADLTRAVAAGMTDLDAILARLPEDLAAHPEIAALRGREADGPATPAPPPVLASIRDLTATVTAETTAWDAASGLFRTEIALPPVLARRPVLGGAPLPPEVQRLAPFLNRWYAQGRAAGNVGDLYDNRDRQHSRFPSDAFQQLVQVRYGEAARARDLDYGPNRRFDFGRITFGNSSTAFVGKPFGRSQTRRLLTDPGGAAVLARQYARNQIYVFPAVGDYTLPLGDLYPANTPYAITSDGRSGSDRPFLMAIALALAALKPEVKARLEAEGRVAPTLQRLLRRTLRGVETEADYLTARAHPVVFRGREIDIERLVKAAQDLDVAAIPPTLRLTVLRETPAREGLSVFAGGLGEALFDTPGAVARIHRTTDGVRRLTVSARAEGWPEGRPLEVVWRVLQGDADRIEITPETEDGRVVRLAIPWHDRAAPPERPAMPSSRIDIAAFAKTPGGHSAPAFVSVHFPPDQARRYDAEGRPLVIDYAARTPGWKSADPVLLPARDWRDTYRYAPDGTLLGWTRARGRREADYTADGHRVLSRDAAGRPLEAVAVEYRVTRTRRGRAQVVEADGTRRYRYAYTGPDDLRGRAETVSP